MTKQLLLVVTLLLMAVFNTHAQSEAFITTWSPGDDGSITIPTTDSYTYAYHIVVSSADTQEMLQEQDATGTVTLTNLPVDANVTLAITGTFPTICMYDSANPEELLSIDQWGSIQWKSMYKSFYLCTNVICSATDNPDLSNVTNMTWMFYGASNFTGDLKGWDVSKVTNMYQMFNHAAVFNSDLSSWNVGNVTDMGYMFGYTQSFNSDLSSWDVSKATTMDGMFYRASSFNGDVSSWNVENVTQMNYMFYGASSFDQDLSAWNVSSVIGMSGMFYSASSFNADISAWDVSHVTNMSIMFDDTSVFNQDLSSWDVSNVTNMTGMFAGAKAFNGDISTWNVSNVISMNSLFNDATLFNQDLSSWDVSKVTNMNFMFYRALSFNRDLSAWSAKVDADRISMFASAGDTYYTITYNEDGAEYLGFYPAGHQGIELRTLEDKDEVPFYAWNTEFDYSGDAIKYIEEANTGDLTLYAQWGTPTSTDENKMSSIHCYPNPVVNQINIDGLNGKYSAGALYNISGAMATKFDLNNSQDIYQVDMNEYAPGIYLLQLQKVDGTTESFKLIKK